MFAGKGLSVTLMQYRSVLPERKCLCSASFLENSLPHPPAYVPSGSVEQGSTSASIDVVKEKRKKEGGKVGKRTYARARCSARRTS